MRLGDINGLFTGDSTWSSAMVETIFTGQQRRFAHLPGLEAGGGASNMILDAGCGMLTGDGVRNGYLWGAFRHGSSCKK
jgi:hypothetical protein